MGGKPNATARPRLRSRLQNDLPRIPHRDKCGCHLVTAGEWQPKAVVHHSNAVNLMSALGQKRTLSRVAVMSALPPKADMKAVANQ